MRSLNLDQLCALMTAVELGSFSAAARRLNLTQPAISLQIRELEARAGVPLVSREGKRLLPTPAGRDLIEQARRIFEATDQAEAILQRHRSGGLGRVRIGSGPTALAYLLPPVLQQLHERHPDIELILLTGTTHEIAQRIAANDLDLGFTALPVDSADLEATPVREDEMVAILSAADPDIPDVVTPADVDKRKLIAEHQPVPHSRLSRAWLKAGGFEPRPTLEFDHIEAIKQAVTAGLGMAIVPRPAIDHAPPVNSIVVRPLDPPLIRTLGLVQRKGRADDPALRIVRDAILTLAQPEVTGTDDVR